jgi:methyl-accepting chemotaxis protein
MNYPGPKGYLTLQKLGITLIIIGETYVEGERSKEELKRIQNCEDLISQGDGELLKLRSILRTRDIIKLETFISTDLYSRVTPINEAINELINIQLEEAEKSIAEGRKLFFNLSVSLIISLLLSIILGSYISYIIIRDLVRSIKTINKALNAIGTGDFTGKIKLTSRDEVSEIGDSINITVKNIRDLISGILEQTDKLMGIGSKLQNNIDDTANSVAHVDKNIHLIDKRISLQRNSVLGIKKSINSLKLGRKGFRANLWLQS